MVKIMFVGKAGAGKSTLSKELNKMDKYHIFSFATRLKEIAEEIKMSPLDKINNPKDRELLQKVGTEVGRWYDSDMWVKQLAKTIKDTKEIWAGFDESKIAIDDCRFLNEAKWGRENGFVIIRVFGRGYELDPKLANHASEKEQELIVADYTLDNSGLLDDTMTALWNIIEAES